MNFNSTEVGQKLSSTILSKLDPTATTASSQSNVQNNSNKLIPSYTQPKVIYAHLPGTCIHVHILQYVHYVQY